MTTQPRSAFYPSEIWPDERGVHINAHGGGVLHHRGVYYWYGEHKIAGKAGNKAHVGVRCYSSTDLYNWTDRGVALAVSGDPDSEIAEGCILERPKVIYCAKTGRFVMWFHLEFKGAGYKTARSGVAVADAPVGPFVYLRSIRPNPNRWPMGESEADIRAARQTKDSMNFIRDLPTGQMARDITVYVDDDGKAYHLFASEENWRLHIAELTEDFTGHTGRFIRLDPGRHDEAPAVCKHGGRYYLITSGCTGWTPNPARSYVADSMLGRWKALGNPCVGGEEQVATTFASQSTHILPVAGRPGALIYMGDRWTPDHAIDGRHIWLPLRFEAGRLMLAWRDRWDLSVFD